ncbi:MAG TPA: single-stranded DNA-binding protein [Clostridiaceae bacterium]|nr:single-stranded DNA-binding protein [Clostridiaceae bacterium]
MNKVILLGRLTRDPELRYTTNNTAVCNFTLAVNRRFAKAGEERQADFIPIVVWDKLAEFCGKYFLKGRQVAIVGRIQTRTWDDNEGKRHYVTEVVAEEAYFADSKPEDVSRKADGFNLDYNDQVLPSEDNDSDDGFYQDDDDDELPF